jgi:peptidyl-prolyl cis-trans isomerase C
MVLSALSFAPADEAGTPPRRLPSVLAAGFAALLAMTAAASAEAPADPVVAKVNGVEIHQSDLNLAEEEIGPEVPASDEAGKRDFLVSYVADLMLVAQAAETKKIPDTAEFRQRLAFLRNKALMETMLGQEGKDALTEPALHKIYEEATKNASSEQEVRARHILFRVADPNDQAASKAAEDKVKATIERIKKGEDFAKLASALTEDPAGKQDGGDLGYFTKDLMVPEFAEAAFGLEKGQISGPVKTQFGWHVLKVEDKRMREPPPFDKVRADIEEFASRKAKSDYVKKLRAAANIERLDASTQKPPAKAAQ